MNTTTLASFTDVLADEICNSQPMSLPSSIESRSASFTNNSNIADAKVIKRPAKGTGQRGQFRSTEEIDPKYRDVFAYQYFNLVQSSVIEDAVYSDKSIVVCAPTGSGKTVVFEMAIVQLLMELEDKQYTEDFKIIYMAPVKALCTERLTEWYSKFTKLGLLCIEVTGDTDVDFTQLKPYKIIITTPEKWDMLTRRWRDHRGLVEVIKLFLIDEVHILNDELRGPVLEAVVSRMKTIESSAQSVHRIEQLQKEIQGQTVSNKSAPRIRFVAVSATVSNPEDVANWLGTSDKPAVFYKFGDECRPVKLKRIVEGYPCPEGTSIFKFDIILNYKLWPIIQKYHSGKPTLIFCNTRKSVILTAETLSREVTVSFNAEQKAKLTALASSIKNKKLQALVMNGVGCHHAGLLYEERQNIEFAFRNRDLPILITTTTLAMGVNLPAHLVIVKNTQQYVNGAYQEYSISTVLQMVGRAGRPQFDTEATAVIMTRLVDKPRYQALVGGCEPLQSFLHKRLAENLNSEAALGTVADVAQCVQWLRSTFLYVRASRDPKKYLGLPQNSLQHLISKKIEELCVKAMNGLASSGLITMDEASCIESTEAGRLMSIFYLDLETMKLIMKIEGTESLERLLVVICESHELADMYLRVDERRCLNSLNRNNAGATIRFPMKGKISTRQMKLNCIIQAVLGCLSIPDPSLNQEAMKIMRITDRVCKCLITYVTRPDLISRQPQFYSAVLNSLILAKCVSAHLWENSPFVSKQLKGIGPTFSTLLASAGKINFILLEESHPRDLERIMNKGAPAGNVLRKQVSLLPKYQLTMIPVDEKTVTVKLVLLNQAFLSENIENLTAGDSHKSYIIVGDSNNHIIMLAAFKDKDLINVFDGTITYEVRRKDNFEHKMFAHCISSSFGIDVQSEYLFNDLDKIFGGPATNPKNYITIKKAVERQTCITDTFKERKRKNTDAIDKTQSKEKKKRGNAIIENFKYLKQSFGTATKNFNPHVYQPRKQTETLLSRKTDTRAMPCNSNSNEPYIININPMEVKNQYKCSENIDSDEFIDDEKIDSILNEIENEMSNSKASSANIITSLNRNNLCSREQNVIPSNLKSDALKDVSVQNFNTIPSSYKKIDDARKRKPLIPKSNYSFIDLLERNLRLSDDDDKADDAPQKENGFSETIKSEIQKYLSKTRKKANALDKNVDILFETPEYKLVNENEKINNPKLINPDWKHSTNPTHNLCPRYEITEILGGDDSIELNRNSQRKEDNHNQNSISNPKVCNMKIIDNIEKQHKLNEVKISPYDSNIKAIRVFKTLHNACSTIIDSENLTNNNNKYQDAKNSNLTRLCIDETKSTSLDTSIASDEKNDKGVLNTCNKINENNSSSLICSVDDNNSRKDSIECRKFSLNNFKLHDDEIINSSEVCNETCTRNDINPNELCINKQDGTRVVNPCQFMKNNSLSKICTVSKRNINPYLLNDTEIAKVYEPIKINTSVKVSCSNTVPNNSYSLVEKNKVSNNNTLIIEDIGHNIHYNHAPSNISSCNPSMTNYPFADFINDIQNLARNSSTDVTCKSEYVRKYTYSTSKIDVCTKQTPEYYVQVIKKVKMDLDITAIMSRNHSSFQNNNSEYEETPKNKEEAKYNELSKASHNASQSATRDLNEFIDNKNYENYDLQSILSSTRLLRSEFSEAEKTQNKSIVPEENEQGNILLTYKNDKLGPCISTENKDQPKQNSLENQRHVIIPINDFEEDENLNVVYGKMIQNLKERESENSEVNEDNKIKNILQKYGKILGKNAANYVTPSSSGISRTATCNKQPTIKPKKPFKISDIHKLHATLPKAIVDHKPEAENKIQLLIINSVETEKEQEDLDSSQYLQCTKMRPIEETVPKYETLSDLDFEPINFSTDVDLEPAKDFKIDQSMFNPKTLLQCAVIDSNEIVPPPPEFCDGISYSSGYDDDAICDNDSQCYKEPQLQTCTEKYIEYNENIFDEACVTDLTPSREIETWNLSRQDSWEPRHSTNLSPVKSFTMMRKNTVNDYNFPRNSGMSRQVKLEKFRYRQKNKLRIKK